MKFAHVPVLLDEAVEQLITNRDGIYVDCTIGGGGHSEKILEKLGNNGRLIGLDQDNEALEHCSKYLAEYIAAKKLVLVKENFVNIDAALYFNNIDKVDGILMDIGLSSYQIDNPERGFSYMQDARLDMRMDKSKELDAFQVVNYYEEQELANVIYKYGEERFSRAIAKAIVEERAKKQIETTAELVTIVKSAIKGYKNRMDNVKRTFQAIRIEVNNELVNLEKSLNKSLNLLKPGGRLVVITFHSLEDRLVKQFFNEQAKSCVCPSYVLKCVCNTTQKLKVLTKKPIIANLEELDLNIRSKSAKLRVAEKI